MSARARTLARLLAAGLACACGPSISSEVDTDDATGGEDPTGTGDASATGSDTQTGEPPCEPRTDAALDWQRTGSDDALPSVGRDTSVGVDATGRIVAAVTDETDTDADVFVSQLDASGTLRWTLRYEGPAGLRDDVLGVAVDPDGLVYVAVLEQTRQLVSEGFGDIAEYAVVILAIDADGGKRWRFVREIPPGPYGNNARAGDIALTPAGDVVLVDADATGSATPPSLVSLDRFGNELVRTDLPVELADVAHLAVAVSPTAAIWVGAAIYGESRILRLDPTGAALLDLREPDSEAFLTAIATGPDEHGHVLRRIGDAEAGTAGFRLSRYAPDGTIAWATDTAFATGDGHPAGVVLDCDGAPIVAAEISDYPTRDAWLFGFTTAGEPTFMAELGEDGEVALRSIARAPDGALVLGGLQGTNDSLGPWLGSVL